MSGAVEIKSRMQSVRETKKVTDAMYMISSVKMKKARCDVANTEPYYKALSDKIGALLRHIPDTRNRYFHTILNGRAHARHGILLITSDKGLAGSYNQTAIKVAEEFMSRHPETVVFIIGEYGKQYFKSKKIPFVQDFFFSANSPTMWKAQSITATLMEYFDEGKLDEINVIFTDYINGTPNECRRSCLIPLDKSSFRKDGADTNTDNTDFKEYIPSAETLLSEIIPSYLTGCVYTYLVDSFCSEQEARMTAMQTAGNNAEDVLKILEAEYNSIRQASITREMTEITSGARALKNKRRDSI